MTNKNRLMIELAKIVKDMVKEQMSSKSKIGMVIGEVLDPPPNIRVQIEEKIILKKDQIVMASHVNKDYQRTFEIITGGEKASKLKSGKVKADKTGLLLGAPPLEIGTTAPTTHNVGTPAGTGTLAASDPKHDHDLSDGNEFSAEGTIKWTNTLKKGDKVVMIPDRTEKFFVLLDKVERL